jgi:DNA-binding IclR family transcriptional regulator
MLKAMLAGSQSTGVQMTDIVSTDALARHRIPVIDRMMDVLTMLERRASGATIRDLVDHLGLPRTTVYRILNTLQFHDMVRRTTNGGYRLGPRLMALASRAVSETNDYDLAAIAQPHLERLAAGTGEGCKISVIDGDGIVVVAAANGKREYALTVVPGQRLPIHAGAAGKVLFANLPKPELAERLHHAFERFTQKTLSDSRKLSLELVKIKRQGWAHDKGEYSQSIHAFAAPIADRNGRVVAALSIPFLAGAKQSHVEKLRVAAIAAARAISADLPGQRQHLRAAG